MKDQIGGGGFASVPRTRSRNPVTVLKTVVLAIRQEPRRYSQETYGEPAYEFYGSRRRLPECGTVGCVALWSLIVTRDEKDTVRRVSYGEVGWHARLRLGLTDEQAMHLFDGGAVQRIADSYRPGTKRYVEAGVRHIERFMRQHLGYKGPKL